MSTIGLDRDVYSSNARLVSLLSIMASLRLHFFFCPVESLFQFSVSSILINNMHFPVK